MRRLVVNGKYFAAPVVISGIALGIVLGGAWVWTGVIAFAACIVLDTLLTRQAAPPAVDDNGEPLAIPFVLKGVVHSMLPIYIALVASLAWRVGQYVDRVPHEVIEVFGFFPVQMGVTGVELLGATLSVTLFMAMTALFGHELSHMHGLPFHLSRLNLSLLGAASFSFAHPFNHHVELATEADPASSPRGRSLYKHALLSYVGQSRFAFNMERSRLSKRGVPFVSVRNRWIQGYLLSLPWVLMFWYAGGWLGLGVLAVVWSVGVLEMEAVNYIEHFGLIREKGAPIDERHSWDNNTLLTSAFFIEIGRQGDHHMRGEVPYWELQTGQAPNTGWGYFTLLPVALVPPLWHRFMRKELARWDRDFATQGEREIARRMDLELG